MSVCIASRLDELDAEERSWEAAHRALSRLARERAGLDAEEGRWLLAALRSAVHVHLGFGGFAEYIERLFGYRPRTTREKLRVAEVLEAMPALDEALRGGALSWCAARELVRVAVPETAQAWLDAARGKTLRQLEDLVAGKAPGDAPDAPYRPEARRHVLRFDVSAETYTTFREAVAALRRDAGASLDDDATLLALARHVLGGSRDAGRASYQIVLRVCPECGSGAQLGDGQLVPVSSEVVEMAKCDAQNVQAPPTPSLAANDVNQPAAHVGHRAPRARQKVPPAVRRAVLQRDEHRCRVPGCRNTRFLDLHHLVPRSKGGRNAIENILTLCGAHHRAVHHGALVVAGEIAGSVSFHHGDGREYGSSLALGVRARVFAALRQLGFRSAEADAALAQLVHDKERTPTAAELLREALLRLTPDRTQS